MTWCHFCMIFILTLKKQTRWPSAIEKGIIYPHDVLFNFDGTVFIFNFVIKKSILAPIGNCSLLLHWKTWLSTNCIQLKPLSSKSRHFLTPKGLYYIITQNKSTSLVKFAVNSSCQGSKKAILFRMGLSTRLVLCFLRRWWDTATPALSIFQTRVWCRTSGSSRSLFTSWKRPRADSWSKFWLCQQGSGGRSPGLM